MDSAATATNRGGPERAFAQVEPRTREGFGALAEVPLRGRREVGGLGGFRVSKTGSGGRFEACLSLPPFNTKERFSNDQDDGPVEGVAIYLNRSH